MNINCKLLLIIVLVFFIYFSLIKLNEICYKFPKRIKTNSKNYIEFLKSIRFIGKWKNNLTNEILLSNEGIMKFNFYKNIDNYNNSKNNNLINGEFLILDPLYYDENVLRFNSIFNLEKIKYFNNKNNNNIYIYNFDSANLKRKFEYKLFIELSLNNILFNKNEILTEKLYDLENCLKIKIFSKNKEINLNIIANLKYEKNFFYPDLNYLTFVFIISLLNFRSSLRIFKKFNEFNNQIKLMNIITIILSGCIDLFWCIFHSFLSIKTEKSKNWNNFLYLIPSFLYFIIFTLVDINLIYLIWKNNHLRLFYNNIKEFKIKLNIFNIKVAIIFLLFLILFFKFYLSSYIILSLSWILLPQIYQYFKMGMFFEMDYNYIIFFLTLKFIILIYFRSINNNLLNIKPYILIMLISLFILIFSCFFIYIQSHFGPRYFFEKFFKKNQFDYFNIKNNYKIKNIDNKICCICINKISFKFGLKNSVLKKNCKISKVFNLKKNYIMVTPCKHIYHSICLIKWMEIKMECPVCKLELPPLF